MKEISISDKIIRVRATPLALLYYKQEFKADLVGDLLTMQELEHDPSRFDSVIVLQIIWAMNKADCGPGKQFPTFERWVSELDNFDMSDSEMLQTIMEEAVDGFFRRGKSGQQKPGA